MRVLRRIQQVQEKFFSVITAPIARLFPGWITPNYLTAVRFLLVVPLVYFIVKEQWWLAVLTYLLAIFTDALDGELARVRSQFSVFGARFDPFIDKVLHIALFIAFWSYFPLLLTILIAFDGFLFFVGLLMVLRERIQGKLAPVIRANFFGKWKFFFQMLSIIILFLLQLFPRLQVLSGPVQFLLGMAVVSAFLSLGGYWRQFLIRTSKNNQVF